jgi:hypothetical protein
VDAPSDRSTPPPAELHVVAAPTDAFFARVGLLAASIRRNGGAFAACPIIVTLSRDDEPWDVGASLPWSDALGIEWRWVDEDVWHAHGMYGSAMQRMRYEFAAPFVVLLDADMVCTGPLDDLVGLVGDDALGGVIAHISPAGLALPWHDGDVRHGAEFWHELFERLQLDGDPLLSEHTGWGINDVDPDRRWCPAYYNLGLLAAPAHVMSRLGTVVLDELDQIDRELEIFFKCQLATLTALARTGTRSVDLATNWNFPNDPHFWMRYARNAQDVRLLHYMRPGEFDRERDTADLDAVSRFATREVTQPPNRLLQATLATSRLDLLAAAATQERAHG